MIWLVGVWLSVFKGISVFKKRWLLFCRKVCLFFGFQKPLLTTQKGISLLEVLIVLSILAILLSLAIPQYRKYQWKAKVAEARIILRAILNAEEIYQAETGKYLTCSWHPGGAGSSSQSWGNSECFDKIGFSAKGEVWCDYAVVEGDYYLSPQNASPSDMREVQATPDVDITVIARCDVDGDGKYSYYAITDETTKVRGPVGDDF